MAKRTGSHLKLIRYCKLRLACLSRCKIDKIAALRRSFIARMGQMETPLTPLEFARRARKLYPERVAVIDGDSTWTYAQFLERCDCWSAVLQHLGIGSGGRVASLSPNTHAQLESFYAV